MPWLACEGPEASEGKESQHWGPAPPWLKDGGCHEPGLSLAGSHSRLRLRRARCRPRSPSPKSSGCSPFLVQRSLLRIC